MNALELFYKELNESNWDVCQEGDINKALRKINEELLNQGFNSIQHLAEIDRQVFFINKTPSKRLSARTFGTSKMKDGSEIPFEWPDIRRFNEDDFIYIFQRFNSCKNIFAKTEYGLVLFYAKKGQDNQFVIELLNALYTLLISYIEKAKQKKDKIHYLFYSKIVLANALHIANNRKKNPKIEIIYKSLIKYTFEVHQNWDVSHPSLLKIIIDYTDFSVQYFPDFNKYISINKLLKRNLGIAKHLSKTNILGAINIADSSIKLRRKSGSDIKQWFFFKAGQYESLSIELKEKQKFESVSYISGSYIEKAMSLYKSLNDSENLNRLQKEYQSLRTEYKLGGISQEIPQDATQRITRLIAKEIETKSEEDIIKTLLNTQMIESFDFIKKESDRFFKEPMIQNLIPGSILDKFGNTIARYTSEKEREKFSLLRTYDLHLQIAIQVISQYFIKAFWAGKISSDGILQLLRQTWIGQEGKRRSNGTNFTFSYLKTIESGINSFFSELTKWKEEPNYLPDFICSTDSLVLKTEYLLREFCRFLDIRTFKQKDEGIVMERTLDDILRDERIKQELTEDDHFFIKFVLTEKAGYNLRNKVVHGLMDNIEYDLQYPLLAIIIILKLSNYKFVPIENK